MRQGPGVCTLTSGVLLVRAGLFVYCRHIMAAHGAQLACGEGSRAAGPERNVEHPQEPGEGEEAPASGAAVGGSEVTARHFYLLYSAEGAPAPRGLPCRLVRGEGA